VKALVGAALALAVLAALVLGAAALLLPRMIASDSVRTRIESGAQAAFGRALRYQRLDFALLPPSLVVIDPSLAGATPEAPPLAQAQRISLRVGLLPLFARRLAIERLVVDGATLRLRRTAAGLELPRPREAEREAGSTEEAAPGGLSAPPVSVLDLRGSTLFLEDASVTPPAVWELREVEAKLRAKSLDAPVRIDASFVLPDGGRVTARGSATLAGDLDLDLDLATVGLASAAPYFRDAERLAGIVSGSVEVAGPVRSPDRIAARLAVDGADLKLDQIELRGRLRIDVDLEGQREARSGRFDIDASAAELVYGGAFRKPPGTPATVRGRILRGAGGALAFDDLELKMHNLDATVQMPTGRRTQMDVRAPAIDLTGWEALLPALAGWRLGGRVTLERVSLLREPAGVRGRLGLEDVQATHPRGGTLVLRGALLGEGPRVRGRALDLVAAGQPFRIDAELGDLGTPASRWRVAFEGRDADVHRLLDGFSAKGDALHGRLVLQGDLGLPVDTGGDALSRLAGRVRIEIRDGWTKGRSLIKTSLDALVAVASPLDLLARGLRIGSHARSKDRFDSITGTFDIADGIARTRDLRIVETDHSIELRGMLGLADLALDMQGSLSFTGEGGGGEGIPLAHVGGTLGDPRVEVTADAARSFAAAVDPTRLGRKLERALSPKAARKLANGLGDLLERAAPERR
jgi:hypothetical protein